MSHIDWDAIIPHLGTDSDANIGKRFNVARPTISNKRSSLGIKPFSHPNCARFALEYKLAAIALADKIGDDLNTARFLRERDGFGPAGRTIGTWRREFGTLKAQPFVEYMPEKSFGSGASWPRPMGDVIDQLHRERWQRLLGAM